MTAAVNQELNGAVETARRTAASSMAFLRSATGLSRGVEDAPEASNQSEPEPAKPAPSLIAASAEMTGSITTPNALDVQGKIDGNVTAAMITVCAGGRIKGDLTAETIIVHGVVEGRLIGRDVRLCAGADVKGEITHHSLGIDTAAVFEGAIKRVVEAG